MIYNIGMSATNTDKTPPVTQSEALQDPGLRGNSLGDGEIECPGVLTSQPPALISTASNATNGESCRLPPVDQVCSGRIASFGARGRGGRGRPRKNAVVVTSHGACNSREAMSELVNTSKLAVPAESESLQDSGLRRNLVPGGDDVSPLTVIHPVYAGTTDASFALPDADNVGGGRSVDCSGRGRGRRGRPRKNAGGATSDNVYSSGVGMLNIGNSRRVLDASAMARNPFFVEQVECSAVPKVTANSRSVEGTCSDVAVDSATAVDKVDHIISENSGTDVVGCHNMQFMPPESCGGAVTGIAAVDCFEIANAVHATSAGEISRGVHPRRGRRGRPRKNEVALTSQKVSDGVEGRPEQDNNPKVFDNVAGARNQFFREQIETCGVAKPAENLSAGDGSSNTVISSSSNHTHQYAPVSHVIELREVSAVQPQNSCPGGLGCRNRQCTSSESCRGAVTVVAARDDSEVENVECGIFAEELSFKTGRGRGRRGRPRKNEVVAISDRRTDGPRARVERDNDATIFDLTATVRNQFFREHVEGTAVAAPVATASAGGSSSVTPTAPPPSEKQQVADVISGNSCADVNCSAVMQSLCSDAMNQVFGEEGEVPVNDVRHSAATESCRGVVTGINAVDCFEIANAVDATSAAEISRGGRRGRGRRGRPRKTEADLTSQKVNDGVEGRTERDNNPKVFDNVAGACNHFFREQIEIAGVAKPAHNPSAGGGSSNIVISSPSNVTQQSTPVSHVIEIREVSDVSPQSSSADVLGCRTRQVTPSESCSVAMTVVAGRDGSEVENVECGISAQELSGRTGRGRGRRGRPRKNEAGAILERLTVRPGHRLERENGATMCDLNAVVRNQFFREHVESTAVTAPSDTACAGDSTSVTPKAPPPSEKQQVANVISGNSCVDADCCDVMQSMCSDAMNQVLRGRVDSSSVTPTADRNCSGEVAGNDVRHCAATEPVSKIDVGDCPITGNAVAGITAVHISPGGRRDCGIRGRPRKNGSGATSHNDPSGVQKRLQGTKDSTVPNSSKVVANHFFRDQVNSSTISTKGCYSCEREDSSAAHEAAPVIVTEEVVDIVRGESSVDIVHPYGSQFTSSEAVTHRPTLLPEGGGKEVDNEQEQTPKAVVRDGEDVDCNVANPDEAVSSVAISGNCRKRGRPSKVGSSASPVCESRSSVSPNNSRECRGKEKTVVPRAKCDSQRKHSGPGKVSSQRLRKRGIACLPAKHCPAASTNVVGTSVPPSTATAQLTPPSRSSRIVVRHGFCVTALDVYNGQQNHGLAFAPSSVTTAPCSRTAHDSFAPPLFQYAATQSSSDIPASSEPIGEGGASCSLSGESSKRPPGTSTGAKPSKKKRRKRWQRDPPSPPTEPSRLPQPRICSHCQAKLFAYEPDGFCCSSGRVVLAAHEIPDTLAALLLSDNATSQEFRTSIRAYNSLFSFTSMGVKNDREILKNSKGIYTFRVQGQIYHYINNLDPGEETPRYLQLYFYNPAYQLHCRSQTFSNVDPSIIAYLTDILKSNPYNEKFQSMSETPDLMDCDIRIRCDPGLDQRTHNMPTSDQVAGIWIDDEYRAGKYSRDILVQRKKGGPEPIKYHLGCYDPLQYPIMFPYGQPGWHTGIEKKPAKNNAAKGPKKKKRRSGKEDAESEIPTVTCRQYYCYRLQIRSMRHSSILFFGRLLQQYIVDMYIKLETSRLDYVRFNQDDIRAELYRGIIDSLAAGETNPENIGRHVVLPPSFVGGPRDMKRRYQDAMALVRQFGKPDYFVTMTCNPRWSEIQDELLPHEEASNRPDLVARIFRAKVVELKRDLVEREILGPIAAYTYVIEYQKRGLPHVHFLLILKKFAKLMQPDEYDRYISAEIPDPKVNPHLYNAVVRHMMHGPCGEHNKNNVCMRPRTGCKNRYSRDFCNATRTGDNSFAIYRRQRNGRTVEVRGATLDNRWVVPYNPYLLAKYDCHINVEICSTIKAVKYLYKYIYKGHDKIAFQLVSNQTSGIDEIAAFQSARWISPPEAAWRLYSFPLNEMYPSVTALPLHLPGMQSISFDKYTKLPYIAADKKYVKTMLTEYFETNKRDESAKRWLYSEFPQHYVWNKTNLCWEHRKKGYSIGRIVAANPSEGDRFFLRLLLTHVRGAESYEQLRTVRNHICESYREACEKLGLLEKDTALEDCLEEAATFQMPQTLRRLFATILVYCQPGNPRSLWDRMYINLSEDFRKEGRLNEAQILFRTVKGVNIFLEAMGRQLIDFITSLPVSHSEEMSSVNREIEKELAVPIPAEDVAAIDQLNNAQSAAYKIITNHINEMKGGCFFVDGPGGTGKTFLYRALLAYVRSGGGIALATASTGIAASNLPGGRTAHSRFKLPLDTTDKNTCNIGKQTALAHLIREAKVIIWDEVTMAKKQNIEAFECMLRDICSNESLFGGKVVVFGGDFRQVLPVMVRATKEECISNSIVVSPLWASMHLLYLTENMRAVDDPTFCQFLLSIGNGSVQDVDEATIDLPKSMIVPFIDESMSIDLFIKAVYCNFQSDCLDPRYLTERAILTPRNDCVDRINQIFLSRFPGQSHTYNSFDRSLPENQSTHPVEFLHTLTPNGIPPHHLEVKPGCPLMLLRNIDPSSRLSNGVKLICKELLPNVIYAEIAVGPNKGKSVFIPRIPLRPSQTDHYPIEFERKQFPVRLCFAMTINKSQGQTLKRVGVYLPQPVFSHGQLYVALSRAKLGSAVKVLIEPIDGIQFNCTTRNVVYKDLLRRATRVHSTF